MNKIEVPLSSARRLLHPTLTVLLTSESEKTKPNIITLAWTMPTSFDPPLVAVSIGKNRFSHEIVNDSREFVINVPSKEILEEVMLSGTRSGRNTNKFEETGLTPIKSKKVKPPRIKECGAHLECKVVDSIQTGDHTIFIGEIVASSANEEIFDLDSEAYDLDKFDLLYSVGESSFSTFSEEFEA